jgi:hypothetical protein
MFQLFQKAKEYSANSMAESHIPQSITSENLNQTFIEDLKRIVRATNNIKNPTAQKKVLEFCLSALVAKYAENKITQLIETDLQKSLNQVLHYARESQSGTSYSKNKRKRA